VYDIDLFDNDAAVVDSLHAQDRKVVAYISAGTWEDWRPDQDEYPEEILGNELVDWPGERWLDIRRIDILQPIVEARLDQAVAKGFDGVDFDNVDAYTNPTGFPLSYQDQLDYNLWLAEAAHERGLSVGLKNDLSQVSDLVSHFDFAVNESCFDWNECSDLQPFIDAGKAVFNIQYAEDGWETHDLCPQANAYDFSTIIKNMELDAWVEECW